MYNDSLFAKLEDGTGYNNTYDNNTLNPYVNFFEHQNTQALNSSLVAESIQMRGVKSVYIRRDLQDVDLVFGEDPRSKFTKHFKVSIYIESFQGWEGEQDWMSRFGYMVNDEMNLTVNPDLFKHQADGEEPRDGDLIYFPMAKSLFEITWVEKEDPWYGTGSLPMRKIRAQKFIYSGEKIALEKEDNFIDSIDDLLSIETQTTDEDIINNLNGRWDILKDEGAEMNQVEEEVSEFKDEEVTSPFGTAENTQFIVEHPTPQPQTTQSLNVNLDDFDF